MIAPSVSTEGGLGYEEGDDLEEDERLAYAKLLTMALADLPGQTLGLRAMEGHLRTFVVLVTFRLLPLWQSRSFCLKNERIL